jgi:hypothetical protein
VLTTGAGNRVAVDASDRWLHVADAFLERVHVAVHWYRLAGAYGVVPRPARR